MSASRGCFMTVSGTFKDTPTLVTFSTDRNTEAVCRSQGRIQSVQVDFHIVLLKAAVNPTRLCTEKKTNRLCFCDSHSTSIS